MSSPVRRSALGGLALLLLGSPSLVPAQTPAPFSARRFDQSNAVVAGTTSMEVLDTTRRLGSGDRLSYRVVEERRDPIPLIVTDSGEVEFPLIGRVPASGKTCRELAYAIRPALERDYFYRATVIIGLDAVSEKSRGRVYLSGQIRQQGSIEIPPDEKFTLSKAILKAGGFADFASHKVKLIRRGANGGSQTTVVNIDEITKRGQIDKDPELLPDDRIIVPEKFINF